MVQITDWLSQSYLSNSAPWNASRCVNMFPELAVQEAKSKSPVALWGVPGTAPFAACNDGPVLGFTHMQGLIYAVTGEGLYRVHASGAVDRLGDTAPSHNGVSIDNNGTTICWVDGISGWTWNASSGVRQITDPHWYPAATVAFFDQYFCFNRVGTRTFFLSPQNWDGVFPFVGDASPSFVDIPMEAAKEATPDLLVAVVNSHQQLYLMGEKRIEVWYDAGNAFPEFPFARTEGAIIQRGLIAPYAWALELNTLFWLGDDLVFYELDGFVPKRVSNHGCESEWNKYKDHKVTRAFGYTLFGHKFIALTFPSARRTWVYDTTTQRWHERESWMNDNADSSIGRWRVNAVMNNSSSIEGYPEILFGDSLSGRIDQLNRNVFTEFDSTIRALVIGPPFHTDRKRVFMKRFELDIESGVGTGGGQTELTETYCATGITMTEPVYIATADALTTTPASFTSFVFSDFVYIPDLTDGNPRGFAFGNNNLQIQVVNDLTYDPQITIQLWNASGSAILDAEYAWTDWSGWTWIGITCDTVSQRIQVWVKTATAEQQLVPTSITWYLTDPVLNDAGDTWTLRPI